MSHYTQRWFESNQSKPRRDPSLTLARSLAGTNWSPDAAKLEADGVRDFPWLEGAYLSQKLGVGAIVETIDGFLVSLQRSKGVAEGQGMMGAPGGHPEPKVGCVFFFLIIHF